MLAYMFIFSILAVFWVQRREGKIHRAYSMPILVCIGMLYAIGYVYPEPIHEFHQGLLFWVRTAISAWLCWSVFAGYVVPFVFKAYYYRPVDTWGVRDFGFVWAGWAALFMTFICLVNILGVPTLESVANMGKIFLWMLIPHLGFGFLMGIIYGALRGK